MRGILAALLTAAAVVPCVAAPPEPGIVLKQALRSGETATTTRVKVRVPGEDGPVVVAAAEPYLAPELMEPAPYRGVLELNGSEIGQPLLASLPPVAAFRQELADQKPIAVPEGGCTWEAESGLVRAPMVRARDPLASGGQFVWLPGAPGGKGGGDGSVTYLLDVAKAGTYYLWGRVLAPTPDDDSFFVRLFTSAGEIVSRTEWPTGTHTTWTWAPVILHRERSATPFDLPAGAVTLQILAREDGTKIDRLLLSRDPQITPPR